MAFRYRDIQTRKIAAREGGLESSHLLFYFRHCISAISLVHWSEELAQEEAVR